MSGRAPLWLGLGLVAAGILAIAIGVVASPAADFGTGTLGWMMGGPLGAGAPAPASSGFVAGTAAAPRVVRIVATPGLRFVPDSVTVKQGEAVTFAVTSMGPVAHEFMVGPAADVASDRPGTPEIADIGMMQTGTLTYTFDGPGPYAYACHEAGHYEAGMVGAITVVP
jgi:uncharacterized cupredoxin-like copper-binding protein